MVGFRRAYQVLPEVVAHPDDANDLLFVVQSKYSPTGNNDCEEVGPHDFTFAVFDGWQS